MTNNRPNRNLRLSPNELDILIREEKKKWQVFRLLQVREQAKLEAQRVRKAVVQEKVKIEGNLKEELLYKYQQEKNTREKNLEQEYLKCLEAFGEAHKGAKSQPDPSKVLASRAKYNNIKANRRGRDAAKEEKENRQHHDYEKNRTLRQKQDVARQEKIRAERVANLPTPEAFKKKKPVIEEKPTKVKLYEAGTYTTTTYVPKSNLVEKEVKSTQPSAHQMAKKEEEELVARAQAELQEADELHQKIELRGKEALERERLNRRYRDLMERLQQAQQDHQLSSYLRGADITIYEKERSRIGGLTSLEKHMERAVEKMSKEESIAAKEGELSTQQTVEASDLMEVADSSKLNISYENKLQDLQEILSRVRQQRQQLLDATAVSSIDDLSKEDDRHDFEKNDRSEAERIQIPSRHIITSVSDSGDDLSTDEEICPHGQAETKDSLSLGTLPSSIQPEIPNGSKGIGLQQETDQSHFKESSPVEYSSEDIDVKIIISDDSSFETDRPTQPVISNLQSRYHDRSSFGQSTEYLSPPSQLPRQDCSRQEMLNNLRKITEHRQRIATLLDRQTSAPHQRSSHFTTPTKLYTKELKGEGSGQRPLKKKEKFELRKKEIIQHYMNQLLKMRGEDLLQISASTVEGSGLTISSMSAFLDALEKTDDESTLSTSYMSLKHPSASLPQYSYSSSFDDIDEVPVKLSSSSSKGRAKHQEYSPATYSSHNSKISNESREDVTSSHVSSGARLKENLHMIHSRKDESDINNQGHPRTDIINTRTEWNIPSLVPSFEAISAAKENFTAKHYEKSLENEQGSDASKTDDVSVDIELLHGQQSRNYEKELEILEKLSRLQKLKQDILKAKSNIYTDERETQGRQDVDPRIQEGNTSLPSDQKNLRKVTFGETHLKKDLSVIYEDSMDVSSHFNKSTSLSYQTPSREYESSPEDPIRQGSSSNTYIPELRSRLYDRSESSYLEYTVPRSMISSNRRMVQDSPIPAQFSTSNSNLQSAEGLKESRFINSGSTLAEMNENKGETVVDEESEQNNTRLDLTAGCSAFTTLHPEDTATSESAFLNTVDSAVTPREEETDRQFSYQSTHSEVSEDDNLKSLSHKSSSESVTSIPDMAEILKKFGLDWAESMMKKMENSEKKSSSENSYHD